MKNKILLTLTLLIMLLVPAVAHAGLRVGPRVGIEVNKLHFNSDLFDASNRVGFVGGLQADLMFGPVGLDASVLYVRRSQDFQYENHTTDIAKDYISVPVNLKAKFSLPFIGKVIAPYIFTGPDFAFLTSRRAIDEAWSNKKVDVAWNFGFGFELIKHLQIGASYGLGMTKLSHTLGFTNEPDYGKDIWGRNNQWTVTAAWLF